MKKYKHQKYFTMDGHRYVVRADTLEELYEKMAAKKQEIREGSTTLRQGTVNEWHLEISGYSIRNISCGIVPSSLHAG